MSYMQSNIQEIRQEKNQYFRNNTGNFEKVKYNNGDYEFSARTRGNANSQFSSLCDFISNIIA